MTVKEMYNAIMDANEAGTPKIGIYQANIIKATKRKSGLTTITFSVNVKEFSPNDILPWQRQDATGETGQLVCWAFMGTTGALKKLGVE